MARPKKAKKVVEQAVNEAIVKAEQAEVQQSPKKPVFTLVLEANKTRYETSGETILDCLNALPLDFIQIKTKGTIIISDGKQTAEKFLPLHLLRRVISGKTMKIVWAKNFSVLLR